VGLPACPRAFGYRPIDAFGTPAATGSFLPPGDDGNFDCVSSRPSPRLISNILMRQDEPVPSTTHTALFVYFGQFLDHDNTLSVMANISCVQQGERMPIPVPPGDPVFDRNNLGGAEIGFTRSSYCFDQVTGKRRYQNGVTAFVDG
jgi:hypothetical protein